MVIPTSKPTSGTLHIHRVDVPTALKFEIEYQTTKLNARPAYANQGNGGQAMTIRSRLTHASTFRALRRRGDANEGETTVINVSRAAPG